MNDTFKKNTKLFAKPEQIEDFLKTARLLGVDGQEVDGYWDNEEVLRVEYGVDDTALMNDIKKLRRLVIDQFV